MLLIQNRVKMWSDYYRERNLPPHFAIVISNDASRIMQGQQVCNYSCDVAICQKAACKKQHIDDDQLLYNIRKGSH